jgi:hypothetical protein
MGATDDAPLLDLFGSLTWEIGSPGQDVKEEFNRIDARLVAWSGEVTRYLRSATLASPG